MGQDSMDGAGGSVVAADGLHVGPEIAIVMMGDFNGS